MGHRDNRYGRQCPNHFGTVSPVTFWTVSLITEIMSRIKVQCDVRDILSSVC
jgi:hypothetical protein